MIELPDTVPLWAGIPVVICLIVGGLLISIGTLGLLRLPNFFQRIHGPAITITLGAGLILIASMLLFSSTQSRFVIHELVITLFVFMTAPLAAMMIMRAAFYRELRKKSRRRKQPEASDNTEAS